MDSTIDREADTVAISGYKNVTFAISERTIAILEQLSAQAGKPVGEILRDPIALEEWYADLRAQEGRILVEQNGTVREFRSV